jgi:hypothetical protein
MVQEFHNRVHQRARLLLGGFRLDLCELGEEQCLFSRYRMMWRVSERVSAGPPSHWG